MLTIPPEALRLAPGDRVLDLGCGEGRHLHALAATPALVAVGLDADAASLAGWESLGVEGAFSALRGDAARLPFRDGAFDAVICSEVLEHLADWRAALDEIRRVVRPGGRVALSVPRYWPEAVCWRLAPGYAATPGGHVRIFRRRDLADAAAERGWRLVAARHAHALHAPYWWLQCLVWDRRERHPAVRAYRRFLEWDILRRPRLTRWLEAALNPLMGKSLALYFEAPA